MTLSYMQEFLETVVPEKIITLINEFEMEKREQFHLEG